MSRRSVVLAGVLCSAALLGACGKSDSTTQPSRTLPGEAATSTTTTAKANLVCEPTTPVTPAEGKPTVTVPEGAAPTTLVITDVKVGDGAEAKTGDTVKMQYVGVAKSNGKEFDSSWKNNAEPFEFTLGQSQVIKGWDQGIVGMKVGGRRTLVIPADLAYGASPPSADIGANDTLIFTVDLEQVCSPAATPGSVPDAAGGSTTTAPGATTTTAGGSTTTTAPGATTTTAGGSTTTTALTTTTTVAK
jgi:peptidylprolyl isomerase